MFARWNGFLAVMKAQFELPLKVRFLPHVLALRRYAPLSVNEHLRRLRLRKLSLLSAFEAAGWSSVIISLGLLMNYFRTSYPTIIANNDISGAVLSFTCRTSDTITPHSSLYVFAGCEIKSRIS